MREAHRHLEYEITFVGGGPDSSYNQPQGEPAAPQHNLSIKIPTDETLRKKVANDSGQLEPISVNKRELKRFATSNLGKVTPKPMSNSGIVLPQVSDNRGSPKGRLNRLRSPHDLMRSKTPMLVL